ncbi:hypothetical protein [Thalassobacillus hwangdonensis]|uniref:Uncharacterized protein n=1 Tax=Thalassobacillus hwangdonensis TaxID=546108 RepID=A0ABW3KZ54_9BACI
MERYPLLYLACILAGFALIRVPYTEFFEPLKPLGLIIGVLAVIVFSLVLLYHGVVAMVRGFRR